MNAVTPTRKLTQTTVKPRRSSRGRTPSGKPNPVDVYVGMRVRQRRTLLGMSQEKLGEGIGLTFQQVQKYERGSNRIGAARLFDMSRVLNVPVSYFFDDMDDEVSQQSPIAMMKAGFIEEPTPSTEANPMVKRETLELVRAYSRVTDPNVRKQLLALAKAFAAAPATAAR